MLKFLTLLVLLFGVPAYAQTGSGARQGGGGKLRALIQQLDLTADQRSQMRSLRSMPKGKERRKAFMNMLTADQKTKLRSLIMQRGGGRSRAGDSSSTERGGPPASQFG